MLYRKETIGFGIESQSLSLAVMFPVNLDTPVMVAFSHRFISDRKVIRERGFRGAMKSRQYISEQVP